MRPWKRAGSQFLVSGRLAWYRAGGAPLPIAAYCPKGAASLAASYVNLVTPGTNNAAPGTAPTFAAATGWAFTAASSQYLTTGITAAGDQTWTLIVRFSDASGTGVLCGSRSSGSKNIMFLLESTAGSCNFWYGAQSARTPYPTSGVVAIAGKQPYRDGSADGSAMSVDTFVNDATLYIGSRSNLASYYTGKIQAVAIYNSVLTAPQVAAVSAAMAAL